MNIKTLIKQTGLALLLVWCASCGKTESDTKPNEKNNGVVNSEMLTDEIQPGDNFYEHVNRKWLNNNPMPNDKSRYGWFNVLDDENKERLKVIFDELASGNSSENPVAKKISNFYNSGMDTASVEKAGISKLQFLLDDINKISDIDGVIETAGLLQRYQVCPLLAYYVSPDAKNSVQNIAGIYQNGLGMPDRDYYLQSDDKSAETQEKYKEFLTKIFSLLGDTDASSKAENVYKIEYAMAEAFNSRIENRNPQATYNKIKGDELTKVYPDIKWDALFKGMKLNSPKEVNVDQPKYINSLGKILKENSIDAWKDYLTVRTITDFSGYLPNKYSEASFEFYGKTISGLNEREPRWKRVQNATNGALGEAIGQIYVEKYFPQAAKDRMMKLVENLRTAFSGRIENLDWMGAGTKIKAKDKLKSITVKIGYPNKWRDYSALNVVGDSYLANALASSEFDFNFEASKIDKPVDKDEWHMLPQTINAYYNPTANEIVFPAAILQPPFFDYNADDAINYGAIGVVIGHEMTHGFDDSGCQFDKYGNINNWWTPEDSTKFKALTQALVEEYNSFVVIDTVHADGELTLGENIADLGGVNISYDAFKNATKGQDDSTKIEGLTPNQRFFISYAKIWATHIRDEEAMRLTKIDPHSMGKFRVNGIVPNVDVFYNIFNVTENNELYKKPEDRIKIW